MPFVLMCGFPCSGKSRRTEELQRHFCDTSDRKVHVISDQTIGINKNEVYADSRKEKEARGKLKSDAQRLINKDDIVILDSLNYIKGFRYELYCVTKSSKTPQSVIFCDVSKEKAAEWNRNREESEQYTQEILDALIMRFEEPSPNQRWDTPLFVVQADDQLPLEQISDALFNKKPPPPNMATQNQPLSSTNFLYELDRVTKETVTTIMEAQKTSVAGDMVMIPGATEKLSLLGQVTLAELQRHRRQFITYTKMHPVDDLSKIPNMFVQYLNNCMT